MENTIRGSGFWGLGSCPEFGAGFPFCFRVLLKSKFV